MKIPEHVVNTIDEENMKNATFPFNVLRVDDVRTECLQSELTAVQF